MNSRHQSSSSCANSRLLRMAWTPQLPSTTWVTPKSTGAEFSAIIRMAESGQHPVGLGFDQRIGQVGKRTAGTVGLLVQHDLKGPGHRTFDRRSAEFAVALGGMRI